MPNTKCPKCRIENESEHVNDDDCTFFKYFTKFNLNFFNFPFHCISLSFITIKTSNIEHRPYVMMDDDLPKQPSTKPPFCLTTYYFSLILYIKFPFRWTNGLLFNYLFSNWIIKITEQFRLFVHFCYLIIRYVDALYGMMDKPFVVRITCLSVLTLLNITLCKCHFKRKIITILCYKLEKHVNMKND